MEELNEIFLTTVWYINTNDDLQFVEIFDRSDYKSLL